MRSTTTNPRLVEPTEDSVDAVEHIGMATDLLQQMFSELRSLAGNNTDLARAMSGRESALRDRLWTLHETADLLVSVNDDSIDPTLMRRARALISWLSAEIDELALYATGDEPQVHANRIALH
jgi:hypothetical protein